MAKLKLTELPRATSTNLNDLIYIVQSDTSKAVSVSTLFGNVVLGDLNNSIIRTFISESISTSNVAEGTNLYFSNDRVSTFVDENITTSNIAEGTNLYFSNDRVLAAFSAGEGITITNSIVAADVISVQGLTGNVVLDTEDISETANLQFFNPYRGYSFVNLPNKHVVTSLANTGFLVSGYSNANPNIYVNYGGYLIFELFSFTHPINILDNAGNLYNSLTHYSNPAVGAATSFGVDAQAKTLGILIITIPDTLFGKTLVYQSNANASFSGTIFINNPEAIKTSNTIVDLRLPPKLPGFSQAEINAMAAENGMMLLNTSNNKVQVYVSPHWRDIHADDYRNRY